MQKMINAERKSVMCGGHKEDLPACLKRDGLLGAVLVVVLFVAAQQSGRPGAGDARTQARRCRQHRLQVLRRGLRPRGLSAGMLT